MDTHRTGDLQIDQDPDAQRHHWIAERVGWTVITLVILAALLGLFGVRMAQRGQRRHAGGSTASGVQPFWTLSGADDASASSGAGRYTRRPGVALA
jgi:hypothetical protein